MEASKNTYNVVGMLHYRASFVKGMGVEGVFFTHAVEHPLYAVLVTIDYYFFISGLVF